MEQKEIYKPQEYTYNDGHKATVFLPKNIKFQIYATHRQIVALKSSRPPKGNIKNFRVNKTEIINNKTKGNFSQASRNKLKETIYNWAATVYMLKSQKNETKLIKNQLKRVKFTFLTLTIPSKQRHTDYEMKALLNNFLDTLARTNQGAILYIWRAETQENGNIHFHLLLDRYFPQWLLNSLWNHQLETLDYLFFSNTNMPQTAHITKIKSFHNIWTYLQKYCAKHSYKHRRGIEGHNWGCSRPLTTFAGKVHEQITDNEMYTIISKAMQLDCPIKYVNDFITIIYLNKNNLTDVVEANIAVKWITIIKDNFDLITPTIEKYKYISQWTTNDYECKHSNKHRWQYHNIDVPTLKFMQQFPTPDNYTIFSYDKNRSSEKWQKNSK